MLRLVIMLSLLLSTFTAPALPSIQDSVLKDAGLVAWTTFTEPVNMQSNLLRNQYRVIEQSTADWIIGWVPSTGFESDTTQDIRVLVHNDGYILAWLPDDRPLSNLIDQASNPSTRLDAVIAKIAYAIDLTGYQVSYTAANHPRAEHIIRIMRSQCSSGTSSMDIRLPGWNTYYDRAWQLHNHSGFPTSYFALDGVILGYNNFYSTGTIPAADLVTNAKHVIDIHLNLTYYGCAWGELVLLYTGTGGIVTTNADWTYTYDLTPFPPELLDAVSDVPFIREMYLPLIISEN